MCRKCGAIVGAGEPQCGMCGEPVAGASNVAAATHPDRETLRFARAILNRPYKFTIVFLITNLFIFLVMWQSTGMTTTALWQGFPTEVLVAYGAKVNLLIREYHQWWRLVTPVFVHVNLIHLFVNMYSLWIVGPYVEKLYGSAKFVVFWVFTGVAGVAASYWTVIQEPIPAGRLGRFIFRSVDWPSAGASGALFGLVGVLFVFGIKFRHELPEGFKRAFGTGMLPIILINLFIGYLGRGIIDNAAHLGGLVSGSALALLVNYRRPGERAGVTVIWRVLQTLALALVALSFIQVARHFHDPIPVDVFVQTAVPQPTQTINFVEYSRATNSAQEALMAVIHDNDTSRIDSSIKELDAAPSLDSQADELRTRLKALLVTAKEIPASTPTSTADRKALETKKLKLVNDFTEWTASYEQWLRADGKKFGVVVESHDDEPRND